MEVNLGSGFPRTIDYGLSKVFDLLVSRLEAGYFMNQAEHNQRKKDTTRAGQSLVEVAILFPIILIVLSGLVEFGFMLNDYLAIQDAARNAARFSSDGQFDSADSDHDCKTTVDFYRQTACLVLQEIAQERPNITLEPDEHDDIVISAFSIEQGIGVVARYPTADGDQGWSYARDLPSHGMRERSSAFNTSSINARLDPDAPNTGMLLVEIYYSYEMKLSLPWITAFIDDPVVLHVYSIMPLVSAEPRNP